MLAPAIGAVRGLAGPADRATALVAGMVQGALARQLQALMTSFEAGNGLHLYIPSEQTTARDSRDGRRHGRGLRAPFQGRRHGSRHGPPPR